MKPLKKLKQPATLLLLILCSFLFGAHCRGRAGLKWWILMNDGTINRSQDEQKIPVQSIPTMMFCTDETGVLLCNTCLDP